MALKHTSDDPGQPSWSSSIVPALQRQAPQALTEGKISPAAAITTAASPRLPRRPQESLSGGRLPAAKHQPASSSASNTIPTDGFIALIKYEDGERAYISARSAWPKR